MLSELLAKPRESLAQIKTLGINLRTLGLRSSITAGYMLNICIGAGGLTPDKIFGGLF